MISEMENIQKGIVVSTVEDSANKRIIGIGTSTVTPDPVTGIAPLSKQNAFVKEQAESVQQAAEKVLGVEPGISNVVPAIEPMPVQAEPQPIVPPVVEPVTEPIQTGMGPLPEPKVNDLITDEPMKVEIPSELSSIPSTEPKPSEEVLATEPVGINEGMFATKDEIKPDVSPSSGTEIVQPLPFESQAVQSEEKPAQLTEETTKNNEQELTLSQEQMEQIAKKVSDLVYREVLELLNGMTKKQTQDVEEKIDSIENLVNPVLQSPTEYEEKPMTMTL